MVLAGGCASEGAQPPPSATLTDVDQTTQDGIQTPTETKPCVQGFVTSIISVDYGVGDGYGQDTERFPTNPVLGAPQGEDLFNGGLNVLTLGLGGSIVLGFDDPNTGTVGVRDEDGPDFIVYENAFQIQNTDPPQYYVELGEVSVSEDGLAWKAFPCDTQTFAGCAGVTPTLTRSDNGISPFDASSAGGDAFDLSNLGMSRAKYVRITDLKAPSQMSGFDLDAVALIHPDCK